MPVLVGDRKTAGHEPAFLLFAQVSFIRRAMALRPLADMALRVCFGACFFVSIGSLDALFFVALVRDAGVLRAAAFFVGDQPPILALFLPLGQRREDQLELPATRPVDPSNQTRAKHAHDQV
ncbi:MAG TPA: hypothetical protein EYQ83_02580 [Acidobacteria bacterium]|nr:hypothetical protein [Acidobacteriota bacterium]